MQAIAIKARNFMVFFMAISRATIARELKRRCH